MVRGWMVPNFRCADIRLVPSRSGRLRSSFVVGQTGPDERLPRLARRGLACGQFEFDVAARGCRRSPRDVGRVDPRRRLRPGLRRRAPAVLAPRRVERGEHLVGRAVALGDAARRHQIRRSRLLERHVPERLADRLVAAQPEWGEVARHVHRRRTDLLDQCRNSALGPAAGDQQPAVQARPAVRAASRTGTAAGAARPTPAAGGPARSRRAPRGRPARRPTARAGRAGGDRDGTTATRA